MNQTLRKCANQFAVEFFQVYFRRHGDKYRNLLLCPFLIYHSLGMMLVGARGNTASQLLKVMRIPDSLMSRVVLKLQDGQHQHHHSSQPPSQQAQEPQQHQSQPQNPEQQQQQPQPQQRKSTSSIKCKRSKSKSRSSPKSSPRGSSMSSSHRPNRGSLSLSSKSSHTKRTALGTESEETQRHREFLMLTEQVLHGNHDFVHLASFIYLDKDYHRTENFKNTLREYYETKPKKLNFSDVDAMCETINEDVARTTENIYSEILSTGEASKLEKSMLLVNAVFFRGFWLSNFTDVKLAPFKKQPEKVIQVKMMSKLDHLPVVRDDSLDARIIMMPYEASDLQMLVILPNNVNSDCNYLCEKITSSKIDQIVDEFGRTKNRTVSISMPIFCIDSGKISIQSTLVSMGAADLFDSNKANMTGVSENKPIWLHKILHRCFIICDNRGAITSSGWEKAKRRGAKLANGIASGRKGVEEFTTDHPFMYVIVDSLTGTILIMGLYTDPDETLEVVHESHLSPEEAHEILTERVYKT